MQRSFRRYFFFLAFIAFVLASCNSTKMITIELPQQGKQELPDRIQSLLLVNRTVDESYQDLTEDSLQNIFYRKGFNTDTVIYDLQSADTLLQALGNLLFESGRYDIVIPVNRFIEHRENAFLSESMKWDQVKELCSTYNTDAVLSVDMFKTRVVTRYERESFYHAGDNTFYEAVKARMAVVYESLFRIYEPEEEKVLVREFLSDTIIWEDSGMSANELFGSFTTVKQALSEAGIALALDFTEKISTTWLRERRPILSDKNTLMQQAEALINQGDWPGAMELWKRVAEQENSKSVRSKAEFNLAVAYEISGDVDKAIEWGLKSYNTQFRPTTYDYLERLKYRKQEIEKMKK